MSTRDLAQQIEKAKTKQKEKRKKRNSKCEPVRMALLNRRLGYPPATIKDLRINILGKKKKEQSTYFIKFQKTFTNDLHSLLHILIRYNEGRRESHARKRTIQKIAKQQK